MKQAAVLKYRWSAPDGRKGRWRKTVEGAVISAAATRYSHDGLRVQLCATSSLALWPSLLEEGWGLENLTTQSRKAP